MAGTDFNGVVIWQDKPDWTLLIKRWNGQAPEYGFLVPVYDSGAFISREMLVSLHAALTKEIASWGCPSGN